MKTFKPALAAVLLALATVTARAVQTNLVENIQIRLVGLAQGGTTTNRKSVVTSVDTSTVDTRQVVQALGAALGQTFSTASRLVLVTPLGGGDSSVQVRDGGTQVDVSYFFSLQPVGASVTSSTTNTRTGNSSSVTYNIQQFTLQDAPYATLDTHFNVSGLGADYSASEAGPGNHLDVNVYGNGDRNGDPLVIGGTISVSGQTLEVINGGGGTN